MPFITAIRARLVRFRELFGKRYREQELSAEIESHVQMHIEDNLRAGMALEEARRQALLKLGGIAQTKEICRDQRGFPGLESALQDVRFGLRMLRKNPGFTAVAVLTLALGIGANTAIFSLVDAALLRLLPAEKPEQLFRLTSINREGRTNDSFSYPTFKALAENNQTLSGLIAFCSLGNLDFVVGGRGELARGQAVSASYFTTLGVSAILGRTITAVDEAGSAAPVAVISYAYWTSRFHRSESAVGAAIVLNGAPFTVIGVTPPEFLGLEPGQSVDVSIPLTRVAQVQPQFAATGSPYDIMVAPFRNWLRIVARLKDGQTEIQAKANLAPVYAQAMRQAADGLRGLPIDSPGARSAVAEFSLELEPGSRGLTALREQFSKPLMFLMAVVGLLLLIACTNVANLLLTQGKSRQKEIALRLAVGAGRARVIRQLITESVLLAAGGATIGVILAFAGSRSLVNLMSHSTSTMQVEVHPDIRVLAFTGLVSLIAILIFGLVPAWRGSRLDLSQAMKETGQALAAVPGRFRITEGLVIAQIALSLVLTVGAGLLVRTLQNLKNFYPGFHEQNVLLFSIQPGTIGYNNAQVAQLYERLTTQIQATAGVTAVSFSTFSPLAGWSGFTDAKMEGYTPKPGDNPAISVNFVGPSYFKALGTAVLRGRDISAEDRVGTPKVAVINEAMAQHFFGDRNPLGRHFSIPGWVGDPSQIEIVGVVENAKFISIRDEVPAAAYIPFFQSPDSFLATTFEVRSVKPASLAGSVRQMILQTDNRLPLFNVKTLSERVDESLVQERTVAFLSTLFGLLALFLTCVGLYGVMAGSVAQRTHEIGIRMALGAERLRVLRLVVGRGVAIALIGVIVGIVASVGATQFMAALLFAVKPVDAPTIVSASLASIGVATLACYIPARRAMHIDPNVALRYE
jgi:predicted permease